ncbi:MAG: MFS transporter [Chloroflexota bacterium]
MTHEGRQYRQRWAVLGIVYLCSLAFAATFQCLPPLLPRIINELNITHAEAGLLMSATSLLGVILCIPAGMLADRYGQRLLIISSLAAILAGQAVFALSGSLPALITGRLLAGAGAMTMTVMLPQLITHWFAGREIGIAMGVFNSGMPLGTIASLNILSLTGEVLGWRPSIWLAAVMPLLALIVFAHLLPKTKPMMEDTAPLRPHGGILAGIKSAGGQVWVLGAAWLFFNAGAVSFLTFTPDFLRSVGYSPASSGLITSAVMWSSLFISPLCGWLIDRYGRGRAMVAAAATVQCILVFLYPDLFPWALAVTISMGLVQPFIPAPVMALAPQVVRRERLGLGFGIISTCLNLGIIIGPWAAGFVRDFTGSYTASYAMMAFFLLLIMFTMLALRLPLKEAQKP